MSRLTAVVLAALFAGAVAAGGGGAVVRAHGVQMTVPSGWQHVKSAGDGPVTDPRTLLVVGTHGVTAKRSTCQIGAYRIPPTGAVVVVVGWTRSNGATDLGTGALARLRSVRRSFFECFGGRGAAAALVLRGREYQVNVIVGGSASRRRVAEALAVGRSFRLGS
jgi:hypothetical protein